MSCRKLYVNGNDCVTYDRQWYIEACRAQSDGITCGRCRDIETCRTRSDHATYGFRSQVGAHRLLAIAQFAARQR